MSFKPKMPAPSNGPPISSKDMDALRAKISAPSGPPPNINVNAVLRRISRTEVEKNDDSFDEESPVKAVHGGKQKYGGGQGVKSYYDDDQIDEEEDDKDDDEAYYNDDPNYKLDYRREEEEDEDEDEDGEDGSQRYNEDEEDYERMAFGTDNSANNSDSEDIHRYGRKNKYSNDNREDDSEDYSDSDKAPSPLRRYEENVNKNRNSGGMKEGSSASDGAKVMGSASHTNFDIPDSSSFVYEYGSRLPTLMNDESEDHSNSKDSEESNVRPIRRFDFKPMMRATYREFRNFLLSPVPIGMVVKCYIERSNTGSNMFSPMYSLCADFEDGTGRELMLAKKHFYSRSSHYVFSLRADDLYLKREQRSRLFVGKLRQIYEKGLYVLYDNGHMDSPSGGGGGAFDANKGGSSSSSNNRVNDDEDENWREKNISLAAAAGVKVSKGGNDPKAREQVPIDGFYGANIFTSAISSALEEVENVEKNESNALKELNNANAAKKSNEDASLYRKEYCQIYFNSLTRPAAPGVRGTEVAIPASFLNAHLHHKIMQPTSIETQGGGQTKFHLPTNTLPALTTKSLTDAFRRVRTAGTQNVKQTKHLFLLHEKTSKYDPISSCLVDFKGRANIPSVKNCQFVESAPLDLPSSMRNGPHGGNIYQDDQEKKVILQMGKTTSDCFNMDVQYPLSLLQAFAICVARFDANLKKDNS
jgi:hypothetical protein